ncbi:hypothetical protein RPN187_gp258 [Escherichia phage vB_EcoM-RPN187]|nr:hypothetical protein RPN187_gp258 [Escherichia phage vB_EcoM-RPN187]
MGYSLALAALLVALYYGVMFGIIQVVLFISDVIMAIPFTSMVKLWN